MHGVRLDLTSPQRWAHTTLIQILYNQGARMLYDFTKVSLTDGFSDDTSIRTPESMVTLGGNIQFNHITVLWLVGLNQEMP